MDKLKKIVIILIIIFFVIILLIINLINSQIKNTNQEEVNNIVKDESIKERRIYISR